MLDVECARLSVLAWTEKRGNGRSYRVMILRGSLERGEVSVIC